MSDDPDPEWLDVVGARDTRARRAVRPSGFSLRFVVAGLQTG
jgi:hypothetical protein